MMTELTWSARMTQNRFDVEETPSIVKERVRVSPKDYNYNVVFSKVHLVVIVKMNGFSLYLT
jgi:hypothetical protein